MCDAETRFEALFADKPATFRRALLFCGWPGIETSGHQ